MLALAGQLTELGELTEGQLTVEERALKAAQTQIDQLDSTLRYWRDALDYDKQQIDATLSVEAAIAQLSAAMQSSIASIASSSSQPQSVADAVAGGYITSPVNEYGSHTGIGDSGYRLEGNTLYFPGGGSHSVAGDDAVQILMETYGLKPGGLNGTLIRTRARGGYTPPGLTWVGEEGPELVNFRAPGMVYTAAQSANLMGGGNTARLEKLVEGLTAEVQRLNEQVNTLKSDQRRSREVLEGAARGDLALSTEAA